MSVSTEARPKLLVPALAGFYAVVPKLGYALVRITIGCILFMHGWAKIRAGLSNEIGFFVQHGFPQPALCAYTIVFFETVGSACVAIGLFTRFFAAGLAIDLGVAFIAIHFPHGFSANHGGYEYVLLLGVVMFAIALRGGGTYSADRIIGVEL
jgi:putative oxidoreductase